MQKERGHEYFKNCGNDYCNGSCYLCTLAVCKVCGLMEGSLTTECPGKKVSWETQQAIYHKGNLDFRNGRWEMKPNPTNQSWEIGRRSRRIHDKIYGIKREGRGPYWKRKLKRNLFSRS